MSKPTFAKVAASSYNPTSKAPSSRPTSNELVDCHKQIPVKVSQPVATDKKTNITIKASPASTMSTPDSNSPQKVLSSNERVGEDGEAKQSAQDDRSTQISSDDSIKPLSFDTKSVASVTTFALDEKESLRPDDSASMRAVPVEEEEMFSAPGSVVAGSRGTSETGAKAFREQFHEIAYMSSPAVRPGGPFPQTVLANPAHAQTNTTGNATSTPPPSEPIGDCSPAPDEALLDALQSQRDRVWVLKLEQDIIDFIVHSKEPRLVLPQCNGFYRKLAHRLADYYRLDHNVEQNQTGAAVVLVRTIHCKLAPPLSALPNLSAANTPPFVIQKRKIMRRPEDPKTSETSTAANSEGPSAAVSEVGIESSNTSEGPSKEGNAGDGKHKGRPTHEERAAKYAEARLRIFGESENKDDACETAIDVAENEESRASSTTGKKPTARKQRALSNDDFQPRSQVQGYYGPPFPAGNGFQPNGYYYGQYPYNPTQQQGPITMGENPMPYPSQQQGPASDPQSPYQWQPQLAGPPHYQHGPTPSYDLSSHFQSGMQSFQNAPPNHGANMMQSHQSPTFQNPVQWSQPQGYDQYGRPIFPPHSMNLGSPGMPPAQPMAAAPYAYGQYSRPYPGPAPRGPAPMNHNQPFNPQTQSFVPRHHTRASGPSHPGPPFINHNMNPMMPSPQAIPPAPVKHQQFNLSRPHMNHHMPSPGPGPQNMQYTHSSPGMQNNNGPKKINTPNTRNLVPEITAKWGTPSHLPPKPPTPKLMDQRPAGLPIPPKPITNGGLNGPGSKQSSGT